jgi:hypothetical protein
MREPRRHRRGVPPGSPPSAAGSFLRALSPSACRLSPSAFRLPPFLAVLLAFAAAASSPAAPLENGRYTLDVAPDGTLTLRLRGEPAAAAWTFRPEFTVLVARQDPKLALRPGGIARVQYNVPTWQTSAAPAGKALKSVKRSNAQAGDGFDDRILKGDTDARTADLFAAAPSVTLVATSAAAAGRSVRYTFPAHADFTLAATVTLPAPDASGAAEPALTFTLTPKTGAYFSVGYTGAPALAAADAAEFFQPFLWQERRFPQQSFLTPAFECSLPATFFRRGDDSVGLIADSSELPFDPLPLLDNSRFGVALRNRTGAAQPLLFAPILGGAGSKRAAGAAVTFSLRLYAHRGDLTRAYEDAARRLYGFRDYRRNAIATLNQTLDRMIDYGLSEFSWFVDALKGCAYSTDVPGAVKNVSALNPLNLALVADDPAIFTRRAYPILEFLLSREKFLFSLDPKQKIQSPSRALLGPSAPVSELAAFYGISRGASPVFRRYAEKLLHVDRTLNLDDVAPGNSWQNNLHVYQNTGDARFLAAARAGADAYLAGRIARGAADFDEGGLFFWTGFAPRFVDLLELFEATREPRYLDAARLGARRYTMFTWMAPQIPDTEITVNPGGNAPVYWYLKSKGHAPMKAPEERVPAWRLSEIGLTPESSGTMSGHRAIFMANYAPWMLRIAALTGDALLHDVARSAIVGRYRNFPGYHINTARTTIYEQADYPLRPHKELSVNSFHYNHIWPHLSILLDYLVTDAFARSRGAIDFPSRFIEGYAYLQSKFYGDRPGRFFDVTDAQLWLPQRLLTSGSVELNHLAARSARGLCLAFTNQSPETVTTEIALDATLLPQLAGRTFRLRPLGPGNAPAAEVRNGRFTVSVPPMGLTAVLVEDLQPTPRFQHRLLAADRSQAWSTDYAEVPQGNTRAMILNFGPAAKTAFVYLRDDDRTIRSATLTYSVSGDATRHTVTDAAYPFEFTVPLPEAATAFTFELALDAVSGPAVRSAPVTLQR